MGPPKNHKHRKAPTFPPAGTPTPKTAKSPQTLGVSLSSMKKTKTTVKCLPIKAGIAIYGPGQSQKPNTHPAQMPQMRQIFQYPASIIVKQQSPRRVTCFSRVLISVVPRVSFLNRVAQWLVRLAILPGTTEGGSSCSCNSCHPGRLHSLVRLARLAG